MEGNAALNPKAKRGRSNEKRSDCPLLTLGLTLDASGFIRHSEVFEGNVSEGSTLEKMLNRLQAPAGALVIMDAGIACAMGIGVCIRLGRYVSIRAPRVGGDCLGRLVVPQSGCFNPRPPRRGRSTPSDAESKHTLFQSAPPA